MHIKILQWRPPPLRAHSVGNGSKVLGLKWQQYKADHPHPLGTEFENECSYISITLFSFMMYVNRGTFNFLQRDINKEIPTYITAHKSAVLLSALSQEWKNSTILCVKMDA